MLNECLPPIDEGMLRRAVNSNTPVWIPAEGGAMRIWEFPQKDAAYLVSADCAGSRDKPKTSDAQSVAYVWCLNPFDLVATIAYHPKEDVYAEDLKSIALFYNHALVAPELTGLGRAVVLKLAEIYDRQYQMEISDGYKIKLAPYPGFNNNSAKTRHDLLFNLEEMVRNEPQLFKDVRFWKQCQTFVDNSGELQPTAGNRDDHLFAAGIGVYIFLMSKVCRGAKIRVIADSAGDDKEIKMEFAGPTMDKDGNFVHPALLPPSTPKPGISVINLGDK